MIINKNKGVEGTGKRSKAKPTQYIQLQRQIGNLKMSPFKRAKNANLASKIGTNG